MCRILQNCKVSGKKEQLVPVFAKLCKVSLFPSPKLHVGPQDDQQVTSGGWQKMRLFCKKKKTAVTQSRRPHHRVSNRAWAPIILFYGVSELNP
jgi:hypothetical protein